MELLLLRHGKAEANGHPFGDGERQLVEKGFEQARAAGELLLKADRLPEVVLTSPLLRAKQTAEAFCEAAGIPGPIDQRWLVCGMSPERAIKELVAYTGFQRVMIVGHEPDLSALLAYFLGALGGAIEMKKGALAGIEIHPPGRHGMLQFLVPPKLA